MDNNNWKEVREEWQKRHASWKERNLRILEGSGLAFEVKNEGEVVLFRQRRKPRVDFYPSTGRWKHNNFFFNGGATAFLRWYRGW